MLTGGATWLTVRNMNIEEIRKGFLNYILEEYEKNKKTVIACLEQSNCSIDEKVNLCERLVIKRNIIKYLQQELTKENGYITTAELVCLYSMRENLLTSLTNKFLSEQFTNPMKYIIESYINKCVRDDMIDTYPFNNTIKILQKAREYMEPVIIKYQKEKGVQLLSTTDIVNLVKEVNLKIMPEHLMFDIEKILDYHFERDVFCW